MPKSPKGERRPADVIGKAVRVAELATDGTPEKNAAAAELGRKGGKKRAEGMTPERRAEIARNAAISRWKKG